MPRHTVVRLFAIPLLGAIVMIVWSASGASAVTSAHYRLEVEYSRDRLETVRCNGDSVPLTARVTRIADGSPVAGAAVRTDAGDAVTNARGIVRGVEIAEPGPAVHRSLFVGATVGDESLVWLSDYSCPFPAGDFGLNAAVFVDRNADGAAGPREPGFAEGDVTLGFVSGQSRLSNFPPRLYGLDHQGALTTTLPFGRNTNAGYEADGWSICLTDRELARGWRIVSSQGTPLAPRNCTPNLQLALGENKVFVGVARTSDGAPR